MIFQWYLFVLLIAVSMFARATGRIYSVRVQNHTESRYTWTPVLILIIPMIYLAATRSSAIGDTSAYMSIFADTPSSLSSLPNVILETEKDKGFAVFTVIIKAVIGNNVRLYFGIIAAICLLCVASVYKRYSCNFIMSMFLFIASGDYVQWNYNGMRQFIAVAIIFTATNWLLQKKYFRYITLVLLVSLIHASALLMIPICFIVQGKPWNLKTVFFLAVVTVAVSFADQFTDLIASVMENSQYANEVDQFLNTEGTNILRVLVFSIPPLLALVFRDRLARANIPIINLSVGMSIASMGVYIASAFTSGIFIGRIPIFFSLYNYILLPWIVENVFDRKSSRLVYYVLIACYMVFYYYQTVITWGL